MLPPSSDNGARLAAVLPSALLSIQKSFTSADLSGSPLPQDLSSVNQFVVIVVDGLGWSNFRSRKGHARTLAGLFHKRLTTVNPTTTGAALTSITTGTLPGTHGLVGYRIRHRTHGLLTTLNDWSKIDEIRAWQRAPTVFERANSVGVRAVAIGRPAHETGGLTQAILTGAQFVSGQTIADRFAAAKKILAQNEPTLVYLYVDELDRAGHKDGAASDAWTRRLEAFDESLDDLLETLPASVGVCITADHGMVDVHPQHHLVLHPGEGVLTGVSEIGGEPRMRYLYLDDRSAAESVVERLMEAEGHRAWVMTRDDAISHGMFGPTTDDIADRIGDVLLAARKNIAYYSRDDSAQSRAMAGQHGSFTDEERGIPLFLAGEIHEDAFVRALSSA